MKLKIDTSKLHLPGPGTAAIMPGARAELVARARGRRADRLTAVRELVAVGLTPQEVRRLYRRIAVAIHTRAIFDELPTVAQDREVLRAVADLSTALAEVLRGASATARAALTTASARALLGHAFHKTAAGDLARFAGALKSQLDQMPDQSRRRAPVEIVSAVAEIGGEKLGGATTWEESKFWRACVAAFTLSGRPTSPHKAIQAYAAQVDGRSPKS